MKRALIGHTGFVGSNLLHNGDFSATFNSSTISDLRGKHFHEIWCAGVKAVKWWANQNPKEDWRNIQLLLDTLKTVTCDRFILISTVDIFQNPLGKNETMLPDEEGLHPYGLHRLKIEKTIKEFFPHHTIVRLPGLFGKGLKKNIIYDFLHDNQLEKIHSDAQFQFYDLSTIYKDCTVALENDLELVHFAVEPVTVHEVAEIVLGHQFENKPDGMQPALYDFQTIHAGIFGAQAPYLQSRREVLERLTAFVSQEREVAR